MAAEPLFDISRIDLDQVVVSRERVGQLNAQCGHMRQLDHVIWTDDQMTRALGVRVVRDDEFWVPGHIPGRPLLPGVLMIESAAQLSSVLYRIKTSEQRFLGFTRCDNAAFRGQVAPGDTLYLLASEVSIQSRRFVTDAQGFVGDRLTFEVRITGMVL